MRSAETLVSGAMQLYKASRFAEAAEAASAALQAEPDNANALNVKGMSLAFLGREEEALPLLKRVVELKPQYGRTHQSLSVILLRRGLTQDAEKHARHAIHALPQYAGAHLALGRALGAQRRYRDAIVALERAAELAPADAEAPYHISDAHAELGSVADTTRWLREAIRRQPTFVPAFYALGEFYLLHGLLDEAIAAYRAGTEVAPSDAKLHSALLLMLLYHPDATAQQIFLESREWARRHEEPLLRSSPAHVKPPDRERLRIGYVSPNFCEHSVAFFIESILEHHDRLQFDVFLYSDVSRPDATTQRIRSFGHTWRDALGMTDEQLADIVRHDQIDVLVDLSQHTANNRLPAFARKPAPVQIAYLGYPGTTGLSSIDYRIGDPHLDPVGEDERFSIERLLRLPETYFCYRPPDDSPPVVEPPCLARGYVTFASHHGLLKLNEQCVALWSEVMAAIPNSRLMLRAHKLEALASRERIAGLFETCGISRERLTFRGYGTLREVMEDLNECDIAFDSYPYSGATTACHTLWMGVPIVGVTGKIPVHRMALSILAQVGLHRLVPFQRADMVSVTSALARDLQQLSEIRSSLRSRMRASPLMQANKFVTALESALRAVARATTSSSKAP